MTNKPIDDTKYRCSVCFATLGARDDSRFSLGASPDSYSRDDALIVDDGIACRRCFNEALEVALMGAL